MSDSDIVIKVRTDGVAEAESVLKRLGDAGVKTETVTGRMVAAYEKQNRTMEAGNVVMKSMMALGMITFLGGMAGSVAKLSDEWTNLVNKLVNANSANERSIDVQNRVFELAQKTRTSLDATATLYARMERSLNSYGVTAAQTARITQTVNEAMIVSGATAEEASAAIIQLSQGLQSGTLRGDEFRSVAEQAPRLLQAMAKSLNMTTGELRAFATQGGLTGTIVANAIYQSSGAIDKEFNSTIATFSQKLSIANNNLVKFAGTNSATTSATSAMGDGIVSLSNHMEALGTVAGILAVTFTGRLISAYAATQAASISSALAAASETAAATALTSSRVLDATAAYEQAQSTLALVAAERTSIQAAIAAEQQYYKGIATMNALMTSNLRAAAATEAVTVSQNALSASIATAITRQTAFNVVSTIGKGILSLMGGPAGVIMLAATAFYMYSASQEKATETARQLGVDTDTLRDRLSKLTTEQQKALQVELQRAQVTLGDALKEEGIQLDELKNRLYNANMAMQSSTQGSNAYASAQSAVKEIGDDIVVQQGKISGTQQQLATTRDNLKSTTDNLAEGERGLRAAVVDTNSAMGLSSSAAGKRSDELTKALQAQGAEADVATLKLQGHARQASILSDVQSRLPKDYAKNKEFIDQYIAGHVDATAVLTAEQQGIVEFIKSADKAAAAQEQIAKNRKDAAAEKKEAKQAQVYADQWDKAYERTEARGATALDRLKIQQESEVRLIEDKATKAGASDEQLGRALLAIDQKYAREREKVASDYSPMAKAATDYKVSIDTINQLERDGLLTSDEINRAKLDAETKFLDEKVQVNKDHAVNEKDSVQGIYDPIQEAKNSYDQQMAELNTYHDAHLVSEEVFQNKRHALYTKMLADQAANNSSNIMNYMQSASSLGNSMVQILEATGKKGTTLYKVMFAASKAFAIANATINLTSAISQALADPTALTPIQKFANMAAVGAAGASLITQVAAVGMAHDGIDNIPTEGTWLLDKGERVVDSRTNGDLKDFLGNNGKNGAANVTLSISNYITMGSSDGTLNDSQKLTSLMNQMSEKTQSDILQSMRENGVWANVLKGGK